MTPSVFGRTAALLLVTGAGAPALAQTQSAPPSSELDYSLPPGRSQSPTPAPAETLAPAPPPRSQATAGPAAVRAPGGTWSASRPGLRAAASPAAVRAPGEDWSTAPASRASRTRSQPSRTAEAAAATVSTPASPPTAGATSVLGQPVPPPAATEVFPASAPVAAPAPTSPPVAPTTPVPAQAAGSSGWLLPAAIGAAVLLMLGWMLLRRPRRRRGIGLVQPEAAQAASEFSPAAPATPTASVHGAVEIAFKATRAGTDLTNAVAEYALEVRNAGDAPIDAVVVAVRLLSANEQQDAELAAFFAEPVARPDFPPFALAAGETRRLTGTALLPQQVLRVVTANDRPFFVPIVAVKAGFGADGAGQAASAHVLGIERPDSPRMGPIWLDRGPRMHVTVGQRPYTGRSSR